jgi:nucleotide-binding universal stress UspA family protein
MTGEVAEMVTPNLPATMQPKLEEGQRIMVAGRGINPVLNFALEEAQLRKAVLCVLYVKEIAAYFADAPGQLGPAKWKDDPQAQAIMSLMIKEGEARGVCVHPVYAVSEDASASLLDLAATLGLDYIILGSSQRRSLADLLRGSVATQVAQNLPESIRLMIYG